MPPARGFRGGRRVGISQSQRRKKSWIQVTGPSIANNSNTVGLQTPNMNLRLPAFTPTFDGVGQSVGLISDPVLDKIPPESTILRIRGSLNLPKNQVQSAGGTGENINFALGIGVMEATGAALGGFPNPATPDGGAWDGWMFYRSQQAGSLDANASVFDVKSMRKVQSGYAVILVFGQFITTNDQSVPPITVDTLCQVNLRALILLP